MNLIWFLTIGTIFSVALGEFGHFPFGGGTVAVSVTDILLTITVATLLIWQLGIQRKLVIPVAFKILILFWITGLISLIFSNQFQGGLYLVRFILYSTSFWLGYLLIINEQVKIDRVLLLILSSGLILALVGLIQIVIFPDLSFLADFGFDPHQNRLAATFLDPNFIGAYLSLCLGLGFFFWLKDKKKLWLVLSLLLILAVILTFSRSAYLMLGLEFIFFGLFKERKIIFFMFLAIAILYLFVPRFAERIDGALRLDVTALERVESWQKGWEVFQRSPFLGVGFNNLRYAYERNNLFKVFSPDGGHSGSGVDSSFIFILATTGIAGFIVYFTWIAFMLKKIFSTQKETLREFKLILSFMVISLLVNSQFINSLFYPPIMLVMFILLGAFEGLRESK